MVKKTTSFTLESRTQEKLADLAIRLGLSRSELVECLIEIGYEKLSEMLRKRPHIIELPSKSDAEFGNFLLHRLGKKDIQFTGKK